MNERPLKELQVVYPGRHGETEWSLSAQQTGLTDLALTPRGEKRSLARGTTQRTGIRARVSSPLQRAKQTCELAGYGSGAEVDRDLVEWHYGEYEGLRSADIRVKRPGWQRFRDGFPGGEAIDEIAARADSGVHRARSIDGAVLLFPSGHFLRVLAARWLGLPRQSATFLIGHR